MKVLVEGRKDECLWNMKFRKLSTGKIMKG